MDMEENPKHECLECGNKIEYGRQDKKFCCNECRNHYNNRRRHRNTYYRSKVLNALERNYKTLSRLMNAGITSISLSDAVSMGFSPDVFTGQIRMKHYTENTCFDIIYRISNSKLSKIRIMSLNLSD